VIKEISKENGKKFSKKKERELLTTRSKAGKGTSQYKIQTMKWFQGSKNPIFLAPDRGES
jgi:hypothetical protein